MDSIVNQDSASINLKTKEDHQRDMEQARQELLKTPLSSIGRIMKLNSKIQQAQAAIIEIEEKANKRAKHQNEEGEPVYLEEYDAWGCGWS